MASVVRKGGVEPPLPCGNRILSPVRLPVPPLPQWPQYINFREGAAQPLGKIPHNTQAIAAAITKGRLHSFWAPCLTAFVGIIEGDSGSH